MTVSSQTLWDLTISLSTQATSVAPWTWSFELIRKSILHMLAGLQVASAAYDRQLRTDATSKSEFSAFGPFEHISVASGLGRLQLFSQKSCHQSNGVEIAKVLSAECVLYKLVHRTAALP